MSDTRMARDAMYWSAAEDGAALCELCPHNCRITKGMSGFCGARMNINGSLIASGYGLISSMALDPIEKKPLYMFHPGRHILSFGGFGCNFRCPFCQNFEISIEYGDTSRAAKSYSPEDVVKLALETVPNGNIGIAYTYNEPLIGYEFLYDCSVLARKAGLFNVIVTNGYINKKPLNNLLPVADAMNIDLKSFSDSFYENAGGTLETIKETIAISHQSCHIEVTTLVIPGENDQDIEPLAQWLSSLDPGIPLHLTRFFPRYKYKERSPTPGETILSAQKSARKYLKNVFLGNIM